jgi:hypothetical protein
MVEKEIEKNKKLAQSKKQHKELKRENVKTE